MLNILLTNLGKYNEGELCGKWFDLEEYEDLDDFREAGCFKQIGIGAPRWDGTVYEEWFVTDYDTDIPGLPFSEYPDLENLIDIAHRAAELNDDDMRAVSAYMSFIDDDLDDALETAEDGEFLIYENCWSKADVARRQHDEGIILTEIPEELERFIDWEAVADEYCDEVYQLDFQTCIEFPNR